MEKIVRELMKYMDDNEIAQMEILFEKPYDNRDECEGMCNSLNTNFGYRVEFKPCLCDCFSDNPNMKVLATIFDKEITDEKNK